MKLHDYQTLASSNLLERTRNHFGGDARLTDLYLKAITGSGKTVIMADYIERVFEGNIIFEGGDNAMLELAKNHLGYQHNKGLDFIAKFDEKYIIGEAKFLTDFGGHQNAQLADALNVIRSEFKDIGKEVIKIAILDGVLYIPNKGKMYNQLLEAEDDEVIISALLLRDFLYSL